MDKYIAIIPLAIVIMLAAISHFAMINNTEYEKEKLTLKGMGCEELLDVFIDYNSEYNGRTQLLAGELHNRQCPLSPDVNTNRGVGEI